MLTDVSLEMEERVRLDSRRAVVARLFPGGVALQFENWVDESWPPREAAPPPRAVRARAARKALSRPRDSSGSRG